MKYLLLLISYFFSLTSFAQLYNGLDASFGTNGVVIGDGRTPFGTPYSEMNNIAIQPDGKIVTGNMRLNANGIIDMNYGIMGALKYYYNLKTLLQPDGKIISTGLNFYDYVTSIAAAGAYRHLPNGQPDSSFGDNGKLITNISNILDAILLLDGKLMLLDGSQQTIILHRYLSNGRIDSTFGINGIAQHSLPLEYLTPIAMTETPDGRVVIGFNEYSNGNIDSIAVSCFLPNGAIDTSFGNGGITALPDLVCTALEMQPDGKILLAGHKKNPDNSTGTSFILSRFNADGTLDSGFGNNGIVLYEWAQGNGNKCRAMKLQSDGKILLAGKGWNAIKSKYDFVVMRYMSNGQADASFGDNGIVFTSISIEMEEIFSLNLQSDGRIIAAGRSLGTNNVLSPWMWVIARYNTDGQTNLLPPNNTSATFELYPNPASGQIRIRLPEHDGPVQLFIYDAIGRIMMQPVAATGTVKTIDISALATGTYFLKANWDNGQTALKKIVKI